MILFFPQWQGAGEGHRLDGPAHVLMDALRPMLDGAAISEVPIDSSDTLKLEQDIWGRSAILSQLDSAARMLTSQWAEHVFVIGGDCGIEAVPVPYLNARHDRLALVWIDAHPDVHTPESSQSGAFHGMPLRLILGDGDPDFLALVARPLTLEQVVMVAVREPDPPEREYIEQRGVKIISSDAPDLTARLVARLNEIGARQVYIHFDLDALDPAEFPYTDFPTPGGLTVAQSVSAVQAIAAEFDVVGMSITEYASPEGAGLDTLQPLLTEFARLAAKH